MDRETRRRIKRLTRQTLRVQKIVREIGQHAETENAKLRGYIAALDRSYRV